MLTDLRHAARLLWRAPTFAIVAAGTLAIGIAANAVVFSFVNALLFRPVDGVRDPRDLVAVYTSDFSSGPFGDTSYPDYVDLARMRGTFESLAAETSTYANLSAGDAAARVRVTMVAGDYFGFLGPRFFAGFPFPQRDPDAVVMSHGLWTRLGRPSGVVGSTIRLDGRPVWIAGITTADFKGVRFGDVPDLWRPLGAQPADPSTRGDRGLTLLGRLAPGVTLDQAQSRVSALAARLAESYPDTNRGTLQRPDDPRPMFVVPHSPAGPDRGDATFLSRVLTSSVGLLLLLASANVANLFLARAVAREHEAAVRLALGASGSRLARSTIAEAIVLAVAGGTAGMIAAAWTADLLPALIPGDLLAGLRPAIDWRVLGLTAIVSIVSGAAAAGLAAWHQTRVAPIVGLRGARDPIGGSGRARARRILVGMQVALALVLLVGGALFLQTLRSAVSIEPGIDPDGLTMAAVELRGEKYADDARWPVYVRLRNELSRDPSVASVTFVRTLPLAGAIGRRGARFEGYKLQPGEDREVPLNMVDRDFFRTVGAPVAAGREFGPEDTPASPPVAIVSQALARRYFGGQAVGRTVRLSNNIVRTIVGIVGDVKYRNVREQPLPVIYIPMAQEPQLRATILVRGREGRASTERAIRDALGRVDAGLPIFDVRTMREHISLLAGPERIIATLVGVCALAALLLASVGIYGVAAYGAARRTREFGIRIALGATPSAVRRIVLSQMLGVTLAGILAGALGAWLLGPLVESALFGTSATNPVIAILAAATLLLVAVIAADIPARRATRVDPVVALRTE
jgi:putative ABC transport system permease protein